MFVSCAVAAGDSWIAGHRGMSPGDILLLHRVLRDVVRFEILVADPLYLMFFAEMTLPLLYSFLIVRHENQASLGVVISVGVSETAATSDSGAGTAATSGDPLVEGVAGAASFIRSFPDMRA